MLNSDIIMRSKRQEASMLKNHSIQKIWNDLNFFERKVLMSIFDKGKITSEETSKLIERSKPTAVEILNKFINGTKIPLSTVKCC